MSITLKDIAKKVGVSTSTISKAVNNRPGVSNQLRNRILETISQMNLQPKQHVGGLIKNNMINVNLLVRINQSINDDPFYSLITEGLSKELQDSKINLLYNVLRENKLSDSIFNELFKEKEISGAILIGADYDSALLNQISQMEIPAILIDNKHPGFSWVNSNNYHGAIQAINHLKKLGHSKIAFLAGPLNHNSIAERFQGYSDLFNNKANLIESSGVSVDDGYQAIKSYQKIDFTALFAATDKLAIGAIKSLKERGFKVPADISIIGFDDIEWAVHTEPSLTTIKVAKQQIGMLAAQLFKDLYQNNNFHQVEINVQTKLIKRNSTGPLLK